jgi:hypothetical protein
MENMQLNEFVSATIKQVIDGIVDAQAYASQKGAMVNPSGMYRTTDVQNFNLQVDNTFKSSYHLIPQMLDFDVAITESAAAETKGGIAVLTGVLGLGAQAKTTDLNTIANRIRFSVPVLFPQQAPNR